MASSKREGAILAVRERLSNITRANGFHSDVGARVFLGETVHFGSDDLPYAAAIVIGDSADSQRGSGTVMDCTVRISVQAIVPVSDEALLTLEVLVSDIKRAMELPEEIGGRSLDGWCLPTGFSRIGTRVLAREEGSTFMGVAVDYNATIEEQWGAP